MNRQTVIKIAQEIDEYCAQYIAFYSGKNRKHIREAFRNIIERVNKDETKLPDNLLCRVKLRGNYFEAKGPKPYWIEFFKDGHGEFVYIDGKREGGIDYDDLAKKFIKKGSWTTF